MRAIESYITTGYERLRKYLGEKTVENAEKKVGELVEQYGLDEIYDDRFLKDTNLVLKFIELDIILHFQSRGELKLLKLRGDRYKKDNELKEQTIKDLRFENENLRRQLEKR